MREKLSLPIGIRGPFGSAKAPPAARSDNALRKERGGRRTRIRAEPPARALRDGREKSTHGRCAEKGSRAPPPCRIFCFSLPCPASPPFIAPRRHRKGRAPTFPRDGRLFSPLAACLSSSHADPAKEARADLPTGRAVVPFPCGAPFIAHADPAKEARADLPAGRAVAHASRDVPSSPHADPAKEARADLPAERAVVHAPRDVPFIAPCRSRQRGSRRPSRRSRGRSRLSRRARAHKKNGAEAPFFCCLFTPWNR